MASTKERAFEAFAEEGPDAHSAAEWAEKLDSKKAYIYQLRGDYRERAADEASEADEPASTPTEEHEAEETTEDTPDDPEPASDPVTAAEGNGGEPSPTTPEASAPTTDAEATSEPSPAETEPADTATDGGEAIAVGHEGKTKLSPDGFEDESTSSIDAPDGIDLPANANPDDFEPDAGPAPDPDPQPEPEPEPENSGGGLLSRIRGDSEPKTTGEVVEDAPTDAEADRRSDVLTAIEGADPSEHAEPSDDAAPSTSTMENGLVMDEDLVANLFGLPFSQAANATGWDGWELTKEEKEANAKLLVAYCDEQNIDLSTGGMLAMSLLSTIGGRAAGYAQHRKRDDDAPSVDPNSAGEASAVDGDESEQTSSRREPEPTRDDDRADDPESTDADEFDFDDSSTW